MRTAVGTRISVASLAHADVANRPRCFCAGRAAMPNSWTSASAIKSSKLAISASPDTPSSCCARHRQACTLRGASVI